MTDAWLPSEGDYKMQYVEGSKGIADAIQFRAYAPHCDQMVLHRPGICWACDGYPDWQQAREVWRINFTGEQDPDKQTCPAELRRPVDTINRWHGNVAETAEQADAGWVAWDQSVDAALQRSRGRTLGWFRRGKR